MQTSERNGELVAAIQVADLDEMMLITDRGTLVRTRVSEVSCTSRNTQGVTLIRVGDGERLVATVRLDEPSDEPSEEATFDGEEVELDEADERQERDEKANSGTAGAGGSNTTDA